MQVKKSLFPLALSVWKALSGAEPAVYICGGGGGPPAPRGPWDTVAASQSVGCQTEALGWRLAEGAGGERHPGLRAHSCKWAVKALRLPTGSSVFPEPATAQQKTRRRNSSRAAIAEASRRRPLPRESRRCGVTVGAMWLGR